MKDNKQLNKVYTASKCMPRCDMCRSMSVSEKLVSLSCKMVGQHLAYIFKRD